MRRIINLDRRVLRGGWAEDLELSRTSEPFGPRNTFSNAAYLLVGFAVWWFAPEGQKDSAGVFMAMMFALGLGSAAYHWYKTKQANALDHFGMYATFGALMMHSWFPTYPQVAYAMPLAGFLFTFYLFAAREDSHDWLNPVMGLSLGLSALPAFAFGDWRLAWLSLCLFGIAYGVWRLDRRRDKWVGLWGHAIWHVLTAVAIGLMYVAR